MPKHKRLTDVTPRLCRTRIGDDTVCTLADLAWRPEHASEWPGENRQRKRPAKSVGERFSSWWAIMRRRRMQNSCLVLSVLFTASSLLIIIRSTAYHSGRSFRATDGEYWSCSAAHVCRNTVFSRYAGRISKVHFSKILSRSEIAQNNLSILFNIFGSLHQKYHSLVECNVTEYWGGYGMAV